MSKVNFLRNVAAIAVCLAVLVMTACGGGSKQNNAAQSSDSKTSAVPTDNSSKDKATRFNAGEWPQNDWTAQVSKPSAGTVGEVKTIGDKNQTLKIMMTWTHEEAVAYAKKAESAGFNVDAELNENLSRCFDGKNAAGYKLSVFDTEIRIVKPIDYGF